MARPRRSGISYIKNDNNRSITFFKRRAGLYKTAADLSTLTSAKIAIALESESGKMSSFGTPLAAPIIDSFLSGNAPVDPFINKEQKAEITLLQNEIFKVEKEKFMEDKRAKETTEGSQKIQETSRKAKLVYSKIEDLSVEELIELVSDLSQIHQEINDRLHPQQPSYQLEVGGSRDPILYRLFSSSSHSQIQMQPRCLPWTPIQQPSLQLPRSSWSLPQLSRSQSCLLNPSLQSSAQAQPMPQLRSVVQLQEQMMLPSTETYQQNYNTQEVHINDNISQPTLISMLPPQVPSPSTHITFYNEFPPPSSSQQLPTPLHIEDELHLVEQPENNTSTQDLTASHPLANHQWPSPIPSNEPYCDISLYELDLYLGDHGDHGGQAASEHDMSGPSSLHQQAYDDYSYRNFLGSSSLGESFGDYPPRNNHSGMGHLSDSYVDA